MNVNRRLPKSNFQLVGGRLSWSRKYAYKDFNLGGQEIAGADKLCQMPMDHNVIEESSLPSASASFLQQVKDLCCPIQDGDKYVPVMSQVMNLGVGKAVETGLHFRDLERVTCLAVDVVIKHLRGRKQTVSKFEEISQIATIAANGDRKIGELVALAFEKVGFNGIYMISDKGKSNEELQVVNLVELKWRPLSTLFINNFRTTLCVLENPLVLIFESKIRNKNVVEQAITMAGYRHLLIVVEDVEDTVAGSLFLDSRCLQTKVCVVTPPKDHKYWKEIMHDLAILTGSQVVTESYDFSDIQLMFGSCGKVAVSLDEMTITGGSGSQATIEKRCEQLRSSIKLSTSNDERWLLEERLAILSRCAVLFKVGGASNVCGKKSQVLNAIKTVKMAVKHGILPGAGVALVHASKELDKLQTTNADERIIIKLFQDALKMPLSTFASTFGFDGAFVVQKLLDQDNPDLGYDPIKGEYVDVMKAGIFDVFGCLDNALTDVSGHFIDECYDLINTSMTRQQQQLEAGGN